MRTFILPGLLAFVVATHAAAERIAPDNVQRLAEAWTYDTGDSVEPVGGRGKPPAFEATPVYADGRLYLSTPQGTVAALDAETGREVWRIDLGVRRNANYSDPANRGPALRGDRLYVGTIDARLVCLQVRDGRRCPKFGQAGEIDLTHGLRHPPQRAGEYGVTSMIVIAAGGHDISLSRIDTKLVAFSLSADAETPQRRPDKRADPALLQN